MRTNTTDRLGQIILSRTQLPLLLFLSCVCHLYVLGQQSRIDLPYLIPETGGHTGIIRGVLFTKDGRHVISAGDDKVVRVWDVASGTVSRTMRGHIGEGYDGQIYALALSPDNKYVATGGFHTDGSAFFIRLFDFQTGQVVMQFLRPRWANTVNALVFSPDGKYLAEGNFDGTVRLWDLATRTSRALGEHGDQVISVSFSPDGNRIASSSNDGSVILWDLLKHDRKILITGRAQMRTVAFSPDGRYLASGGSDKIIRLWSGRTGKFIRILGRQSTVVHAITFTRDGRQLLTGTEDYEGGNLPVCNVFDVRSGKIRTSFREHTGFVIATAISPNMKLAATAGSGNREIYVWKLKNGQVFKTLIGEGRSFNRVEIARDSRSIAFETDTGASNSNAVFKSIFVLQTNEQFVGGLGGKVTNESDYVSEVHHHADYRLTTRKDNITNYDAVLQVFKSNKLSYEIPRDGSTGYQHTAYSFTHDGKHIVSGGDNGILTLYDTIQGNYVRAFHGHLNAIQSVSVSLDNQTLVSFSSDQTIKIWDIGTAKNLLTIFIGQNREWAAWTPQGYYTSSLNGDKYLGWHQNNGFANAADFYTAEQFQRDFYRPDVVAEYLNTRNIELSVRTANNKRRDKPQSPGVLDASTVSSSLPPIIDIDSPQGFESTVSEDEFRVKATVTSTTIPIQNIRVFLNGNLVASLETNSLKSELTTYVKLKPNLNILLIVASNNQTYSAPEIRKIYYEKPKEKRIGSNSETFQRSIKGIVDDPTFNVPDLVVRKGRSAAPTKNNSGAIYSHFRGNSRRFNPVVVFVEPEQDGRTIKDSLLNVAVTAGSTNSNITRVTMFVNDREQGSWSPGIRRPLARFTALLKPGRNVIKIIASDEESESEPETRTVFYEKQEIPQKPYLIFLGVGVNNTKETTLTPLQFAQRDVERVAQFFANQKGDGKPFEDVFWKVIPNNTNLESTKAAIINGLDWMKDRAKEHRNNIHILYLAGHGAFDNDQDRNYYFFSSDHIDPANENYDIPWPSIATRLTDLLPYGTGLLFIDTCHAGSVSKFTDLISVANKYGLKEATGIAFFLASDAQGVSSEHANWEGGHGAFTAALIRGLRGEADQAPFDGQITIREIDDFIRVRVPADYDERQKPGGFWVHGSGIEVRSLARP